MAKRQPGSSQGGLRTKPSGKSPRFRANHRIELAKQEQSKKLDADRRKPHLVSSVQELFHGKKK